MTVCASAGVRHWEYQGFCLRDHVQPSQMTPDFTHGTQTSPESHFVGPV